MSTFTVEATVMMEVLVSLHHDESAILLISFELSRMGLPSEKIVATLRILQNSRVAFDKLVSHLVRFQPLSGLTNLINTLWVFFYSQHCS